MQIAASVNSLDALAMALAMISHMEVMSQLPHRCSSSQCGAPVGTHPITCTQQGCEGLVHGMCFAFSTGSMSMNAYMCSPCVERLEPNMSSCLWDCSMRTIAAEKCSVCQGPVHPMCQATGKQTNGWATHGESVLYFPAHHPNVVTVGSSEHLPY